MAGEWSEAVLSDVMEVKHGFAFPGENIKEDPPGDILLTPGNFAIGGGFKDDKFKYFDGPVPEDYILNENDLIVTMTDLSKQADTLGYPALVPKPHGARFLHNQRLGKVVIRPNAELEKRFLFYLLRTAEYRHEVLASATGTTVKHTSPSRILAHKVALPLLPEQKAIASVLGTLDDKIELNRRMNETLEVLVQSLFKSWFVDATQAALPNGWREVRLVECCENIFSGGTPSTQTPEFWDGDIPWLSSGETRSKFIIATEKTITPEGIANSSTRLAQAGSTVIASAGQGHTRGQTSYLTFDSYINQSVVALVADQTVSSDIFLFFDLERRYEQFRQISDSHSSRGSLTTKLLSDLKIILPPRALISEFDEAVRPMTDRIISDLRESRTLAALRDALLPKLLSGELRIPTALHQK